MNQSLESPSFYSERYLGIINVLKEHGLWDLKYGLVLLPLIQHCMPAPSIPNIRDLIKELKKESKPFLRQCPFH